MSVNSKTSDLLEVRDLTVHFSVPGRFGSMKKIVPVDHVSFRLGQKDTIALVGESGSGKTTTGRTVLRLIRPVYGEILYQGHDVVKWSARQLVRYHRSAQMIFQDPYGSLNPVHTVFQHLALPLRNAHKTRNASLTDLVDELLNTVGLTPAMDMREKYPHELSGGQRQRVAIARALAVHPQFLVADEPISMLDVSIRAGILHLLEDLQANFGLSMIYITHDLASARYIAGRIFVMYGGVIVESAYSGDLIKNPYHPYTRLLLAASPGSRFTGPLPETGSGAPNLEEHRVGCVFQERCPYVMPQCRIERPPVLEIDVSHNVACYLYSS